MSKICRLCLQSDSEKYYPMDTDSYRHKIQSLIPEIDIEMVEQPFICLKCSELLLSAYTFKSNCLQTNKELKTYARDGGKQINLDEFLRQKNQDLLCRVKLETEELIDTDALEEKNPVENVSEKVPISKQRQKIEVNKCPVCNKLFLRKSRLDVHLRRHKYYKCDICDKSMLLKTSLEEHMRTHTGERPYQCTYCGNSFAQSSTLGTHIRSIHMSERPYACEICGKGFKVRGGYTAHKRIRHGSVEKKFVCYVCGKAYHMKCHLEQHMIWHKGEKNYLCQVCSKGFVNKAGLTRHLLIHNGEKRFGCPICQKTFNQSTNMKIHLKSCSRRNGQTADVN